MIHIQNLSKSYGTRTVLNGISIQFEKGKVYGIVGENGAGKTTLFRCIAGLEQFDGVIDSLVQPLKNKLGYLAAEQFFFDKITGREYVQLLCNGRKIKVENLDLRNIFDLPLDQYAVEYSTGMKKKLALFAVLLQENEVFILDEPFNGVDIQSNIIITEIIHELKRLGKTIIISSHIFSTLKDTCDEVHLLQNGSITRSVKVDEFDQLENDMKQILVGDRIEKLNLR